MVTQRIAQRSAFGFRTLIAIPLILSGCVAGEQQQFFSSNTSVPANNPDFIGGMPTVVTNQKFNAVTGSVKKIDFLFVVDNSGSMGDNQAALAAGFEQFANSFYRRADLDICTTIITSDRYLGRVGPNSYQRERNVACTKPTGWQNWSQAQMDSYISGLIQDFKTKVNVGTNGSGTELLGKSLVSFLYNLNAWGDTINQNVRTSMFRSDAVANISFVTDENNWYFGGYSTNNEAANDLPPEKDTQVYNDTQSPKRKDTRKGIKNYLDDFFNSSGLGLSYSVTSLLEITQPSTTVPGIAVNLDKLVDVVGRESVRGDIESSAQSFANIYNSLADSLIIRAYAFSLAHDIFEPNYPNNLHDLKVSIIKANGTTYSLSYGSDFGVAMPNGIVLNQVITNTTQTGDQVSVDYRYANP